MLLTDSSCLPVCWWMIWQFDLPEEYKCCKKIFALSTFDLLITRIFLWSSAVNSALWSTGWLVESIEPMVIAVISSDEIFIFVYCLFLSARNANANSIYFWHFTFSVVSASTLLLIPSPWCLHLQFSKQVSGKVRTEVSQNNILVSRKIHLRSSSLFSRSRLTADRYSCGPTVYDSSHIGHASTYVTLDIIHRVLKRVFNFNIVLMMGITDIDDKIIQRSQKVVPELTFNPERSFFVESRKMCTISKYRKNTSKSSWRICSNSMYSRRRSMPVSLIIFQ